MPFFRLLWPPDDLQTASNDSNELSGLNNPCWSLSLAPKCFFEPFQRKKEGQNGLVDLRARTSPQVKIGYGHNFNKISSRVEQEFTKQRCMYSLAPGARTTFVGRQYGTDQRGGVRRARDSSLCRQTRLAREPNHKATDPKGRGEMSSEIN